MYSPSPYQMRIRVAIGPRDPSRFPPGDEPLGLALLDLAEKVVTDRQKLPRPAVLAFHHEQVEQYDLAHVIRENLDVNRFVSAIAGQPGIEAVAVLGVLNVRFGAPRTQKRPPRTPALISFIEWPDCRWWSAIRPLDQKTVRDDWPAVIRAADEGYPRPRGLGGWFSRARREGLCLQRSGGPQAGLGLVH